MAAPTVAVVGNGLIGSAAARHLAARGAPVTIIGPGEPAHAATHDGVFSSHADEGRLVSRFGRDRTWSTLTQRSIANFEELATRSGIWFHAPVGRLSAGRHDADERAALERWAGRLDPTGSALRVYRSGDRSWQGSVPFLALPPDVDVVVEAAPAGYVNPRALLRAQNAAAFAAGATLVEQRALGIDVRSGYVDVSLDDGRRLRFDRVLVAAGAFTSLGDLLPAEVPLRLKTETTIRAAVREVTASSLRGMPVVTHDIENAEIDDIYLAPPITYPDGVSRLKLGCNTPHESWPESLEEVQEWFRRGDSDLDRAPMEAALRDLLPDVELLDVVTHRCIVTYTPTGYPTIDRAPGDEHGRLFVAAGGNGTGAQCSDALGDLAARLTLSEPWDAALPGDLFRADHRWGGVGGRASNAQQRAAAQGQSTDTA